MYEELVFVSAFALLLTPVWLYFTWKAARYFRRRRWLHRISGTRGLDVSRIYVDWDVVAQVANSPGAWPVQETQLVIDGAAKIPPEGGRYSGVWRVLACVAKGEVSAGEAVRLAHRMYVPGMRIGGFYAYHGAPASRKESHRNGERVVTIKYRGSSGDTYVFVDGLLVEWTISS